MTIRAKRPHTATFLPIQTRVREKGRESGKEGGREGEKAEGREDGRKERIGISLMGCAPLFLPTCRDELHV
jgi:hypothetical protein